MAPTWLRPLSREKIIYLDYLRIQTWKSLRNMIYRVPLLIFFHLQKQIATNLSNHFRFLLIVLVFPLFPGEEDFEAPPFFAGDFLGDFFDDFSFSSASPSPPYGSLETILVSGNSSSSSIPTVSSGFNSDFFFLRFFR